MPPAIAAVMPITRGSRLASATIASAKTLVYAGADGFGGGCSSFSGAIESGASDSVTAIVRGSGGGAGLRSTIDPGFAACHFSMPSRPPSSAGAKPLPLTVWMWTTTGRSAASASRQGRAQCGDVVTVDHAHVGEVELLEQQPGGPVGLDRRLDLGAEPLDLTTEAERQLGEPLLDVLAGVVQARVEPEVVEVARERADVR